MELYREEENRPKGVNKVMLTAVIAAAVLVLGGIGALTLIPSEKEQQVDAMQGALREGSPGFEQLSRMIVAETAGATQSKTPMGMVLMNIGGNIYNAGEKTITALEITVAVRDSNGGTVRDRPVVVVPSKNLPVLAPKKETNVGLTIDGFKEDDDRAEIRWKVTAIKAE